MSGRSVRQIIIIGVIVVGLALCLFITAADQSPRRLSSASPATVGGTADSPPTERTLSPVRTTSRSPSPIAAPRLDNGPPGEQSARSQPATRMPPSTPAKNAEGKPPSGGTTWSRDELEQGRAAGHRLMKSDRPIGGSMAPQERSTTSPKEPVAALYGRWAPAQCTAWSAVGRAAHIFDSCDDKRLRVPPWVAGDSIVETQQRGMQQQTQREPTPPSAAAMDKGTAGWKAKAAALRDGAHRLANEAMARTERFLRGGGATIVFSRQRGVTTQEAAEGGAGGGGGEGEETLEGFISDNETSVSKLRSAGYGRIALGRPRRTLDQCGRFIKDGAATLRGNDTHVSPSTVPNDLASESLRAEWKIPLQGFCTSWRTGTFSPPTTHQMLVDALATLPQTLQCDADSIFGPSPFTFTQHRGPRSEDPQENRFGSLEADFKKVCGWEYLSPTQLLAVLHRAAEGGTRPIVISGDSMMRNIFGRVVAAIRGQSFVLEHSGWVDIRYVVRAKTDEVFVQSPTHALAMRQNIPPLYKQPECNVDDLDDPCLLLLQFLWAPYDDVIPPLLLRRGAYPTRRYANSVLWTGLGRAGFNFNANATARSSMGLNRNADGHFRAEDVGLSPRFEPHDAKAVPAAARGGVSIPAWVPPDGCLRSVPTPPSTRTNRREFVRAEFVPPVHIHGAMYWFREPPMRRSARRQSVPDNETDGVDIEGEEPDDNVVEDDLEAPTTARFELSDQKETRGVSAAKAKSPLPLQPHPRAFAAQKAKTKKSHGSIFFAARRYRRFVSHLVQGTQAPTLVPPPEDRTGSQSTINLLMRTKGARLPASTSSKGSSSKRSDPLSFLDALPRDFGRCGDAQRPTPYPVPYRFIHVSVPPMDGGVNWYQRNKLIVRRNRSLRTHLPTLSSVFSATMKHGRPTTPPPPTSGEGGAAAGSAAAKTARSLNSKDVPAVRATTALAAKGEDDGEGAEQDVESRAGHGPGARSGTAHIIAFDSLIEKMSPLRRVRAKKDYVHYQCTVQKPLPRRPAWIAGDWNGCYDDVNLAVVQWYALALHAFALDTAGRSE